VLVSENMLIGVLKGTTCSPSAFHPCEVAEMRTDHMQIFGKI
jgi:hypothetical protein